MAPERESLTLDVSDEIPSDDRTHVQPDGTIQAKRVRVPARGVSDPEKGAGVGYIIECPSCGQWGVLGTDHDGRYDPSEGLTIDGPWTCPDSHCDFVGFVYKSTVRVSDPNGAADHNGQGGPEGDGRSA